MALIIMIRYPRGEIAWTIGYPIAGSILRVDQVPCGPEACYGDEIEADFTVPEPYPVVRIVGGPRRPTIHVRLADPSGNELGDAARDLWMDARDAEGWYTNTADDGSSEIWVVAMNDDLDPQDLVRAGAAILG